MFKLTAIIILAIFYLSIQCKSPEKDPLSFLKCTKSIKARLRDKGSYSGLLYMLKVYSEAVQEIPGYSDDSYQLTPQDLAKIKASNSYVNFPAFEIHKNKKRKATKLQRMWFDTKEDQNLVEADLRFFRDNSKTLEKFQNRDFNLTIYRVMTKTLVYVDSVIVDGNFEGWVVLNVTQAFHTWTKKPELNEGLKITTVPLDEPKVIKKIKPESFGLVGFDGDADKQPFAAAYYFETEAAESWMGFNYLLTNYLNENIFFRDPDNEYTNELGDNDMIVNKEAKKNIHDHDHQNDYCEISNLHNFDKQINEWKKSMCQLRKIEINLNELGLDFIIAPAVVDVNDCIGRCKYPYNDKPITAERVLLKYMMGAHNVCSANAAECVPIAYEDRTFLFFTTDNALVCRKIKSVSASACGCR